MLRFQIIFIILRMPIECLAYEVVKIIRRFDIYKHVWYNKKIGSDASIFTVRISIRR